MSAKAGLIDHISPGRLQFIYIAKQQILNSGFRWSILSGQLWSSPLVFPPSSSIITKLATGLKRWQSLKDTDPCKRLRHKAASLFIAFPFALIQPLWLLPFKSWRNSAIWHRKVSHTIKTVFFMKSFNKASTVIFQKLVSLLGENEHLKLDNAKDSFMYLSFEKLYECDFVGRPAQSIRSLITLNRKATLFQILIWLS